MLATTISMGFIHLYFPPWAKRDVLKRWMVDFSSWVFDQRVLLVFSNGEKAPLGSCENLDVSQRRYSSALLEVLLQMAKKTAELDGREHKK